MRASPIAALMAVAFLASCTTGTDGDGGVPHDRTTVLGTLLLFEDVWNNGDMNTYRDLLDEDAFTFYFDPMDVEHGLPESWGYADEITAVANLFNAIGEENVDAQLDLDGVVEPEQGVATCKVERIPYDVRVYDKKADPQPTEYLAIGRLDMELEYTDGVWVITKWWDRVSMPQPGICECSWGALKALY
jgi:hypothetical protein